MVLNSKKLELRRERVTFFRAEYSAQGMHPDPKKVQGITEMTASPQTSNSFNLFLGMVMSGLNRIDFPTSRKVDAVDPFR